MGDQLDLEDLEQAKIWSKLLPGLLGSSNDLEKGPKSGVIGNQ